MILLNWLLAATVQATEIPKLGSELTCIYPAVHSWNTGEEYVKTIPVRCVLKKVVQAEEQVNYYMDCTKGLKPLWGNAPGVGIVKGHKLNPKKRWFSSNLCYLLP